MDPFEQLVDYTKAVCRKVGVPWRDRRRRNWREWDEPGGPTGFLIHFTASNAAVRPGRPLGRVPHLLSRFAVNSGTPGVHLIAMDRRFDEFEKLRAGYPVFDELEVDVFCWGLDKAFYHGNQANGWAVGVENRNCGVLKKKGNEFFWHRGTAPYRGRAPAKVRGLWVEPYTLGQIKANILLLRWLRDRYGDRIRSERVLGHCHVTSNRTDPMPHFPLALVRKAAFEDRGVPLESRWFKWFDNYGNDTTDFLGRYDDWLERLVVEDRDDEDIFAREDRPDMVAEPGLDLYGDDGRVTGGDGEEALRGLEQLGYYPNGNQGAVDWTIKLFQSRWVKRRRGRWVNTMDVTGRVDRATLKAIRKMKKQFKLPA